MPGHGRLRIAAAWKPLARAGVIADTMLNASNPGKSVFFICKD